MKMERDHIWPLCEGGPDTPKNMRDISRTRNRKKGPEMPTLSDIADSTDRSWLAHEIEKHSLSGKGYRHPRNKNKGYMGLPLRRP